MSSKLNKAFEKKADEQTEFNRWNGFDDDQEDTILGIIKELDVGGQYDSAFLNILTDEEEDFTVWITSGLKFPFQNKKYLKGGDWTDKSNELIDQHIAIKYLGEEKSKGGRMFRKYSILWQSDLLEMKVIKESDIKKKD